MIDRQQRILGQVVPNRAINGTELRRLPAANQTNETKNVNEVQFSRKDCVSFSCLKSLQYEDIMLDKLGQQGRLLGSKDYRRYLRRPIE